MLFQPSYFAAENAVVPDDVVEDVTTNMRVDSTEWVIE